MSNTEASVGSYDVTLTIGLLYFPNVPSVTTEIRVEVICPSDGTLSEPALITVPEMLTTEFVYFVNSEEALIADLPGVDVASVC